MSEATRATLPRRKASKMTKYTEEEVYPDGPPATEVEKSMHFFNLRAYPWSDTAFIDATLVAAMFSSKGRAHSQKAMDLETAVSPSCTRTEAVNISRFLNSQSSLSKDEPTSDGALVLARNLCQLWPAIFPSNLVPVTQQCLYRYFMMYSKHSYVRLDKISFAGGAYAAGLRASKDIAAGQVLLTTCSSMCSDEAVLSTSLVSVIQPSVSQLGAKGPRLILGPFRFANHDCDPNAQIMPIPRTHAFVICAIKKIEVNEPVTVSYNKTGYKSYSRDGAACACKTCNPKHPPVRTHSEPPGSSYPPQPLPAVSAPQGVAAPQGNQQSLEIIGIGRRSLTAPTIAENPSKRFHPTSHPSMSSDTSAPTYRDWLLKHSSVAAETLTPQQRSDRIKYFREIEGAPPSSPLSDDAPLPLSDQTIAAGNTSVPGAPLALPRKAASSTPSRGTSSASLPRIQGRGGHAPEGGSTLEAATPAANLAAAQTVPEPAANPGSKQERTQASNPATSTISRVVSDTPATAMAGLTVSAPAPLDMVRPVRRAQVEAVMKAAQGAKAAQDAQTSQDAKTASNTLGAVEAPAFVDAKTVRRANIAAAKAAALAKVALVVQQTGRAQVTVGAQTPVEGQAIVVTSDAAVETPKHPDDMEVEEQLIPTSPPTPDSSTLVRRPSDPALAAEHTFLPVAPRPRPSRAEVKAAIAAARAAAEQSKAAAAITKPSPPETIYAETSGADFTATHEAPVTPVPKNVDNRNASPVRAVSVISVPWRKLIKVDKELSKVSRMVFGQLLNPHLVEPPRVNTENWGRHFNNSLSAAEIESRLESDWSKSAQGSRRKGKGTAVPENEEMFETTGAFKDLRMSLAQLLLSPDFQVEVDLDERQALIQKHARRAAILEVLHEHASVGVEDTVPTSRLIWAREQIMVMLEHLEDTMMLARHFAQRVNAQSKAPSWNMSLMENFRMIVAGRQELQNVSAELDSREAQLNAREVAIAAREAATEPTYTHSRYQEGQSKVSSMDVLKDLEGTIRELAKKMVRIENKQEDHGSLLHTVVVTESRMLGATSQLSAAYQQDRETQLMSRMAYRSERAYMTLAAQRVARKAAGPPSSTNNKASSSAAPVNQTRPDEEDCGSEASDPAMEIED